MLDRLSGQAAVNKEMVSLNLKSVSPGEIEEHPFHSTGASQAEQFQGQCKTRTG